MGVKEIIDFLKQRPGYLKEGSGRLANQLRKRGFKVTKEDCLTAIRMVKGELSIVPTANNKTFEPKVLFFDIEVSYGLARAWRPGYKINLSYDDFVEHPKIICISYKWGHKDEVSTLQWDDNQNDFDLLKEFSKELNKADYCVGHNVDAFDLPWVRSRAIFHGIQLLPKYVTVDTLKIARYKYRFPSNRLDDLGDYLKLGRKIKTERKLWVDVIEKKCPEAMDKMIKYCEQDVLLLEQVYNAFRESEYPVIHTGVQNEQPKITSPFSGTTNIKLVKTVTTKAGTIKRIMKCLDTNKYFEMSNSTYKKFLEQK